MIDSTPILMYNCIQLYVRGEKKCLNSQIKLIYLKKMIIKVEQNDSMAKIRDYLQAVQRAVVADERFRSLIVYYDVDPQ